ncbi:MAG: glycerophosphodiester phosphodiesterase family protein [Christensenella sp.]
MILRIPFVFISLGGIALLVLLLSRIMTKAAPPAKKTWLTDFQYAHRGLHNPLYPENSLPAFENAVAHGFAIELDVQMTRDGKIVVFHDATLERMAGINCKISDCTLAELRNIQLGDTQYTIPTLHETLRLVNGRVPLLIEIKKKGFAGALERELYNIMNEYGGKYAVQSFSPFSMRWFKKNAPRILRGQLSCNFSLCKDNFPASMCSFVRFFASKLLFIVQRLWVNFIGRPNFISYELQKVNSRLIRRLRKSGAPIFAWTVRTYEEYLRAKPYTDSVIFENFTPYI